MKREMELGIHSPPFFNYFLVFLGIHDGLFPGYLTVRFWPSKRVLVKGILWPPDVKGQLIGKDPDTGKD